MTVEPPIFSLSSLNFGSRPSSKSPFCTACEDRRILPFCLLVCLLVCSQVDTYKENTFTVLSSKVI